MKIEIDDELKKLAKLFTQLFDFANYRKAEKDLMDAIEQQYDTAIQLLDDIEFKVYQDR